MEERRFMGEVIVITSGKGGVGKTTVTANLGAALSQTGKKVCVVDTDMGLRNLDLALGMENSIVYDSIDVVEGICSVDEALVEVTGYEGLSLVPAPQSRNCDYVTEDMLGKFVALIKDKFDYILLDSPAGIDRGFRNAISSADGAIVVTQPFVASVRDADRAIDFIEKAGIENIRLVINAMVVDKVKDGVLMNVDNIIDVLGIQLLGIIPYDENIPKLSVEGKTVIGSETSLANTAYMNITKRLMGEEVPIMDMSPRKKGFFARIFKK